MKRTLLSVLLIFTMMISLSACSKKADTPSVYYLNFKPEQNDAWVALGKEYEKETGVEVKILTAASGEYEPTLTSEIAKKNAPTLFQVNGPIGLSNWKEYCLDLTDTKVYAELVGDEFALKEDGRVLAVAFAIESYGIIYNKNILNKYFASDVSSIKSIDGIKDFSSLKTVAEELQQNKALFDIDGAFTSAGMDGSSDWRFKTHLANVPLYYEYKDKGISSTNEVSGKYLDNYKQIWDLYINNATCPPSQIATKTGDDAANEFASGKAAFYQNGTWALSDITGEGKLSTESIGMLPIYIGAEGEEEQGLCTGSENYWCVNKDASEEDVNATLDFLYWVITSETGTTALSESMGFSSPFKKAKQSKNVLESAANEYIKNGKTPVAWNFSTMPSESWKNGVGSALTAYAEGRGSWDDVKNAFVNGWKSEYDKINK